MTVNSAVQGHARLLLETRFNSMVHEFSNWTMSDFIRQLESRKSKGRVFSFIRGLRLSAHLIYAIRDRLIGSDLTANWGHLLDNDGNFVRRFGRRGGSTKGISQGRAIAVDKENGFIHVVDSMRMLILVYNSEGRWQFEWGKAGKRDGCFYYPSVFFIDNKSRAYIKDMTGRLQVFEKKEGNKSGKKKKLSKR